MSATDAVFAGRVAEGYDRLMVPMLFEAYAAEVPPRLPRLAEGHVLETAAGTGIVTAAMAAALPAAVAITATDLNPPMLDRAAPRLPSGRVTLRQADAQRLPFEDGAFDALVCQFGVMFFPDKPAALAEARRVLRPGGRLLFSVWSGLDRNPIPAIVQAAVAAQFPDDPPLFMARTPHGHGDIPGMTAALEAAGFTDFGAERVELPCRSPSARLAATAICQGTPLRAEIEARRVPGLDAVTEIAAQALARKLAGGAMNTPVSAPMEAIFFSAIRPG
ncbi:class I SAM-dependent methyltransferase [Falsiroseomonas sp. HW251]|uniref:class I SAM-dependent methyltransferase n=1 Tax=Falsiroseomonas sp. HW251 TaxID=3390998 RepID=UPI003D321635